MIMADDDDLRAAFRLWCRTCLVACVGTVCWVCGGELHDKLNPADG